MPVVVSTIVKDVSAVVKGITTYIIMEDLMGKTNQTRQAKTTKVSHTDVPQKFWVSRGASVKEITTYSVMED